MKAPETATTSRLPSWLTMNGTTTGPSDVVVYESTRRTSLIGLTERVWTIQAPGGDDPIAALTRDGLSSAYARHHARPIPTAMGIPIVWTEKPLPKGLTSRQERRLKARARRG